jgi:hypothetical protein
MRYVAAIAKRDWHAIAKLYVFGELVRVRDDGFEDRAFPSIRDIARRFRISRSAVGDRALREDWVTRRVRFQTELGSAAWEKLIAREVARAAAPSRVR